MNKFKVNTKVYWKWLGKEIPGHIEEVFTDSVTKTIKGSKITRHGTKENPAYLVISEAGNKALKLGTELHQAKSGKVAKTKPKMFS